MTTCLKTDADGVLLAVQVQPRASRNRLVEVRDGELRLRLTAPPVEGAANKACRDFLAKTFGLAKSRVELVAGDTARHKRFRLCGLTLPEAEAVLAQALAVTG